MEKVAVAALTLLLITFVDGTLREPFPLGYEMGNLGTILTPDCPGGREPFSPAAYLGDSLFAGICASVTTYYDDMDNFGDKFIATVAGGGWLRAGRVGLKAGISHFDALGAYRELTGRFSGTVTIWKGIRIGADITGIRLSTVSSEGYVKTLGESGFSLFVPLRMISFSFSVDRLTVKSAATAGVDRAPHIRCGLHTAAHTFGAQGVRVDILPENPQPVSVAIGEELRISRSLALQGAVANNPIFVAVGISLFIADGCASAALVNHPVLGWSRGFGAQYGWRRSGRKKDINL